MQCLAAQDDNGLTTSSALRRVLAMVLRTPMSVLVEDYNTDEVTVLKVLSGGSSTISSIKLVCRE